MKSALRAVLRLLPLCVSALPALTQEAAPRVAVDLDGAWSFQREGSEAWREVQVPSAFEAHEGVGFNGVGIYRRSIDPPALGEGQRAWLHVTAAATEATVQVDGVDVGHHLGGWTLFRCDVTEVLKAASREGRRAQALIRVDEKVGHNTQGFLPIVQPHFGGIWQGVRLLVLPETAIDDTNVLTVGDPATNQLVLEVPLTPGSNPGAIAALAVRYRQRGEAAWSPSVLLPIAQTDPLGEGLYRGRVSVNEPKLWSPESPALYEVEISLVPSQQAHGGLSSDRVVTRAAFRSVAADGRALRLNGDPLVVRGVLDWGYAPPTLDPSFTDEEWLDALQFASARGFNLIKFCLWVPPKRLLNLCDEQGMLAWIEYPTWHPTLDETHRADLVAEFEEFFAHDRNHPSVVLRSLTCETGPSADLAVIADLYQLGKRMVPGALIEDDSSWIGWNRISDIWDDHPYGNNHTWSATLGKLKEHVRSHGRKPLLLGEAIAADSWLNRGAVLDAIGDERPYWVPGFFDAVAEYEIRMGALLGEDPSDLGKRLVRDSLRYGHLMRKYQVETYRREVPRGGYVVSVVRDFPLGGCCQ